MNKGKKSVIAAHKAKGDEQCPAKRKNHACGLVVNL